MSLSLYDHQLSAIEKLETGSILCGGVGSGKSRAALAYYYLKVCDGSLSINGVGRYKRPKKIPLYIITTAHKRDLGEWEYEALAFPGIKPIVDSWNNIQKYKSIKNAFFIFDEQRVVGYGKWSRTFIDISKHNDWILLSATPGDTWMDYLAVFIANGYFKNKSEFIRKHVVFSRFTKYPKIERYVNTEPLERYRSKILVLMPFIKPTISHHEYIYVDYDKETSTKVIKDRWNIFDREPLRDAGQMCLILRRIANTSPARIEKVKDLIARSKKSIVFYNYNYELDILREVCEDLAMPYGEWNGHNHDLIPTTDEWCYLVQYTAGSEGWNCIETNTMIFYSENYSYKVMEQASGRINRMNTPFVDLYYYHLTSHSLIDQAIAKALNRKKIFNEKGFYDRTCR